MTQPAHFLTIAFSHYCEKARWAMDRLAVPYLEDPHLPMFHWWATFRRGAGRTVPVLRVEGRLLKDSSDILLHLDAAASPAAKLYPDSPEARQECLALEELFDDKLGPHTRRLLYYHLLPDARLTLQVLRAAGPAWERWLVGPLFPLLRKAMMRGLRIDAEGARKSRARIDAAFLEVEHRLSDGRRFLLGDTFTAADLTFAALAAPALQPAQYGVPLPPLETFSPAVQTLVRELRETVAGRYVMRLYAEERGRVLAGR